MKTRSQYAAAQSARKRMAIVDRVIEQLSQHGPMTATGLAGRLGLTAQSVSVALFHESTDRVSVVRNGERRLIYFLPTAHQVGSGVGIGDARQQGAHVLLGDRHGDVPNGNDCQV